MDAQYQYSDKYSYPCKMHLKQPHKKKNNNFQNLQHLAACQIELGHIVCTSAAKGRHAQNYEGAQVWVQTLGVACSPRSH